MAKNMISLLQPDQLPTFKKNAKERSRVFDLEKILPMYEKIYSDLIKN
jgi:hypothetical protein